MVLLRRDRLGDDGMKSVGADDDARAFGDDSTRSAAAADAHHAPIFEQQFIDAETLAHLGPSLDCGVH